MRRGEVVRHLMAATALLTVAACAPVGGGAAAAGGAAQSTTRSSAKKTTGTAADCTKATKVTITGDPAAFTPSRLTIRRGGFLAIVNKSGEVHDLVATPDAGIVKTVLDLKERQVVQFPKAGTFTVASASAQLKVTVSGESGCGTPEPTLTIADGYAMKPAKLSVTATENFTVVNESGANQTVMCTPDPGGNRDNSKLDKGETQILAIDEPGTYVCASVQHPGAKATITVNAR